MASPKGHRPSFPPGRWWGHGEGWQQGAGAEFSHIEDTRSDVLLVVQLKVPPTGPPLFPASIQGWQRSSSCGYQGSSGVSRGSQGPPQPDFLSRKNKERRHGIRPASSLIYCRITRIRHSQIAPWRDASTPK